MFAQNPAFRGFRGPFTVVARYEVHEDGGNRDDCKSSNGASASLRMPIPAFSVSRALHGFNVSTRWRGCGAMRISVSCWATTEDDTDVSATAVVRIAKSIGS
jgi:hypothetical protein